MKKMLSMLLSGAMLFSTFTAITASADEPDEPRMELFSQDFEGEDTTPEIDTGKAETDIIFVKNSDDSSNNYGMWTMEKSYRSGYTFGEGVISGNVHVSFDFMTTGDGTWRQIAMGSSATIGAKGGVPLLSVNQAQENNGNIPNALTVGGRKISKAGEGVLVTNSKQATVAATSETWYTYDGVIDLDNRTITVTLKDRDSGEEIGSCATGTLTDHSTGTASLWEGFGQVPTAENPFDCITVTSNNNTVTMSLDNIKVEADPVNDDLIYRGASGAETENAYSNTKTVGVRFNAAMENVDAEAVKLDDQAVNGELSEDGRSYLFPVEQLTADKEYTVTVDCSKLKPVSGGACSGTKTVTFTPISAEELKFSENFEGDAPTIYDASNGLWKKVEDANLFEVGEDGKIGTFHKENTKGNRIGFDIGDVAVDGTVKISFKFRSAADATTFVILGNEYTDKSMHNWLNLLTAKVVDGTRYLYAGTGHGGKLYRPAGHTMKTPDGSDASIKDDTWYTYDALLDIDNRSLDAKVTDADGNEVGGITLLGMNEHNGADNDQRFNDWPENTDFRMFGTMYRTDLDDITIEKSSETIEGAGKVSLVEDFDGAEPIIYNHTGHTTPVDAFLYAAQTEDDGNKYGRFHVSVPEEDANADYRRIGMDISGGPKGGKINVSFKFRPPVSDAMNTTVLIGNEPDSKSLYNWLSLLNVTSDRKLLIARTYNATEGIDDYMVKDTNGAYVMVEQGNWYGYNAVIDLDAHSMDVKITDASGTELGGIELNELAASDGSYNLWPKETYFKAFATLFPTELDDISVTDYTEEEEPPVVDEPIEFKAEGGSVSASIDKDDVDAKDSMIIIAQYDETSKLVKVEYKKTSEIQESEGKLTLTSEVDTGAKKVKAMLWNGFEKAGSLKESAEQTIE